MRAKSPAYLAAKEAIEDTRHGAKARLSRARAALEDAHRRNLNHQGDLARYKRSQYPIITNEEAHRLGVGSGYNVIYSHRWPDDPYRVPYDETELAELVADIKLAEKELDAAMARLDAVDPKDFDVWEGDHRYVYWPMFNTSRDYQGRPVSAEDLEALGPQLLQERIHQGVIIERLSATVNA